MVDRLHLYALSARNAVGRVLGVAAAYTPAQRATATVLYRAYRREYDAVDAAAILGCNDGECSFLVGARGDRGEAGGIAQWHVARRNIILRNAGIDVWTAPADKQAEALMAEMSAPWSWYKHVGADLRAAASMEDKVRVLVHELEQSGMQDRDVARRTPMANYWLDQNLDGEATA